MFYRKMCSTEPTTGTGHRQNTLIVLLSSGEPPQADNSAKKAIRHYFPVTSQIIMGGTSHAPAICRLVVGYYNRAAVRRCQILLDKVIFDTK